MMLSLIGTLVWMALWIYYGAVLAIVDEENGPLAAIFFFIPACMAAPFVGKFYSASLRVWKMTKMSILVLL